MECPIAKSFQNKSTNWQNATCRRNIALEHNEIIYGALQHTSSSLTLNHLIGTWNIFFTLTQKKWKKKKTLSKDFLTLVKEKIEKINK